MGSTFRSLLRHPVIVAILVFQIAAAFAVVSNMSSAVLVHLTTLLQPTGVREEGLSYVKVADLPKRAPFVPLRTEDVAALARHASVDAVAYVDALPLSGDNWSTRVGTNADLQGISLDASIYSGSPGEIGTLGLRLVAGHDFARTEYQPLEEENDYAGANKIDSCIITHALASALGVDVGGSIYGIGKRPLRVIGIVDSLLRPTLGDSDARGYSILLPLLPDGPTVYYVVRSKGTSAPDLAKEVSQPGSGRVIAQSGPISDVRDRALAREMSVLYILLASGVLLLAVTYIGIFGLFNFWIASRSKSLGIRRALGATQGDILRECQTESLTLCAAGLLIGVAAAVAISTYLLQRYEVTPVSVRGLAVGAVALAAISQLATLGPSVRASKSAPITAVRGR